MTRVHSNAEWRDSYSVEVGRLRGEQFNYPPVVQGHWVPEAYSWLAAWQLRIDTGNKVKLYKATDENYRSGVDYGKTTVWHLGCEVTCNDWNSTASCGGGLHLGPTPRATLRYVDLFTPERVNQTRFLLVEVDTFDLVPIASNYSMSMGAPWDRTQVDKCKVPRALPIAEVNLDGQILRRWVPPVDPLS